MKRLISSISVALFILIASGSLHAGLFDFLKQIEGELSENESTADIRPLDALTNDEMIAGLKEALNKGSKYAIRKLGKEGGFLRNEKVRIPMPEDLVWIEKSLRSLGQERLADEFIASINHAAERAVPEATAIFSNAIQRMSLIDAQGILNGPDDAATRYFRDKTSVALTRKMRPIVEQATERAGVTSYYKKMIANAGGLVSLLSSGTTDLDGYVTERTLDGLFMMVAEEERRIRENPVARSSALLEKVFGN
ncbi:MAG: DUF4197 domain-containing protein [Gammaproteobacteria bacterium]|nr:DUF4197 domain-containing protein [Gammaproteobacteria bacterium]